jgi:hypothetical protein
LPLFACKLTEISINASISFGAEKERKWGVKSVDLTKYCVSLTDLQGSLGALLEMMLMFSEKHAYLLGKT